jgi:WD40 repeat protein
LVQLWDPATLRVQRSVSVPYQALGWIDVSPDLQLVAVHAYQPEVVEVYDFASGQPKFRFEGLSKLRDTPPGAVSWANQVAFSGDSKRLLVTGILSAVLADLTTGEERLVEANGGSVFAAIDATGDKILTSSAGAGPYVVRDATTLAPLASGFTGRAANRPQFNPTHPLVMTDGCCCKPGNTDDPLFYDPLFPLEIWDATTGQDIGTTGWKLNCGFWYPNGKGFVGYDFQIEFWDLDPEQWVAAPCRFAGRNLTQDEWDRYGPKDTYRETCP